MGNSGKNQTGGGGGEDMEFPGISCEIEIACGISRG